MPSFIGSRQLSLHSFHPRLLFHNTGESSDMIRTPFFSNRVIFKSRILTLYVTSHRKILWQIKEIYIVRTSLWSHGRLLCISWKPCIGKKMVGKSRKLRKNRVLIKILVLVVVVFYYGSNVLIGFPHNKLRFRTISSNGMLACASTKIRLSK